MRIKVDPRINYYGIYISPETYIYSPHAGLLFAIVPSLLYELV